MDNVDFRVFSCENVGNDRAENRSRISVCNFVEGLAKSAVVEVFSGDIFTKESFWILVGTAYLVKEMGKFGSYWS
jgi:hypothetical protein